MPQSLKLEAAMGFSPKYYRARLAAVVAGLARAESNRERDRLSEAAEFYRRKLEQCEKERNRHG